MLKAISSIEEQMSGLGFEEFVQNETIAKAVLYDFLVIGEAAINIPNEVQSRYPAIPWRLMSDMRNVVAHEYFQVNLKIIWNTARKNLPPLVPQLQALLEDEAKQGF
jgi:uncharacterized protein with HEPN domain